jgi:hypothetical protein
MNNLMKEIIEIVKDNLCEWPSNSFDFDNRWDAGDFDTIIAYEIASVLINNPSFMEEFRQWFKDYAK